MRTLRLTVAYDGTDFHGWQRQPGVRSVQGELEAVAQRVLRHPLSIRGASRTDAGVHAAGQVACLRTSATIPLDRLMRAIGERLPADLALLALRPAAAGFHPGCDALGKLYRYRLHAARQRPTERLSTRYTWHIWVALDIDRMRAAAELLCGRHDFRGFASSGEERGDTVRTLRRAEIQVRGLEVWLDFEGDGFLYNQVRNMVGTLVEIGRGLRPVERISEVLAARDRGLAGPTAPARGLCLRWVRYPPVAVDGMSLRPATQPEEPPWN